MDFFKMYDEIFNESNVAKTLERLYVEVQKDLKVFQMDNDEERQKVLGTYDLILNNLIELSNDEKLTNEQREEYLLKAEKIKKKILSIKEEKIFEKENKTNQKQKIKKLINVSIAAIVASLLAKEIIEITN